MLKLFLYLPILTILFISCDSSSYTNDEDQVIKNANELLQEQKEKNDEVLKLAKEVKKKKDKLLKDYDGKEKKLIKKAKKGDKDALSTLKELRELQINYLKDSYNLMFD